MVMLGDMVTNPLIKVTIKLLESPGQASTDAPDTESSSEYVPPEV